MGPRFGDPPVIHHTNVGVLIERQKCRAVPSSRLYDMIATIDSRRNVGAHDSRSLDVVVIIDSHYSSVRLILDHFPNTQHYAISLVVALLLLLWVSISAN